MKDYTLNAEDSKTFIQNYTIKDNQIIVNFASGESCNIPYNPENESKLLKKMKTQVLEADEFMQKQEQRCVDSKKWMSLSAPMIVLNALLLASGLSLTPIFNAILLAYSIFDTSYRLYNIKDSQRNIDDVYKNLMLLNNEEKLNKSVKENQSVMENTDKRTKELIASTPENEPIFTLNSIDNIEYEQLKQILENIDELEERQSSKATSPKSLTLEK